MGLLVQFSCFLLPFWFLNYQKMFCNFVLQSARNLSLLQEFVYIHLKFLIFSIFRKRRGLLSYDFTYQEILAFGFKESCYIFAESYNPQYLVSCGSDHYKLYYFLRAYIENFQMHLNKLFYVVQISCGWQYKIAKKSKVFVNLGNINSGGNHGNQTNNPILFSFSF